MTHEERQRLIRQPVSFWVGGRHSWGGVGVTDWFFTDGRYRAYSYQPLDSEGTVTPWRRIRKRRDASDD